jgi:hypothetical protein
MSLPLRFRGQASVKYQDPLHGWGPFEAPVTATLTPEEGTGHHLLVVEAPLVGRLVLTCDPHGRFEAAAARLTTGRTEPVNGCARLLDDNATLGISFTLGDTAHGEFRLPRLPG